MKILITGATGFIGKELGKELVRRGHTVRVMSRNIHRARQILPFPAEIISGREGLPPKALHGIDAVINLAGEPLAAKRWTKQQKEKIRDSRIKITSDLMRLVRYSPVKTVISASAIGFYGDRGDEVLTEESGPGSGFLAEVCRAWEAELFHGVEGMSNAPRLVAIRFGVVLGRNGGALEKLLPLFRKGMGGTVGSGRQQMSWIHIQDLVQMIVFALENKSVEGILNGVGPEPVDNWEFTRALAKVIGRPASLPVPSFLLRLVLGEMSQIILTSQKVMPSYAQRLGFKFDFPALDDALKNINDELRPGEEELFTEQFVPVKKEKVALFFNEEKSLTEVIPKMMSVGFTKKHSKWSHTQKFIGLGSGTIIQDRVVFQMPAGWLGQLGGSQSVANEAKKMFKVRRQIIDQKLQASD